MPARLHVNNVTRSRRNSGLEPSITPGPSNEATLMEQISKFEEELTDVDVVESSHTQRKGTPDTPWPAAVPPSPFLSSPVSSNIGVVNKGQDGNGAMPMEDYDPSDWDADRETPLSGIKLVISNVSPTAAEAVQALAYSNDEMEPKPQSVSWSLWYGETCKIWCTKVGSAIAHANPYKGRNPCIAIVAFLIGVCMGVVLMPLLAVYDILFKMFFWSCFAQEPAVENVA